MPKKSRIDKQIEKEEQDKIKKLQEDRLKSLSPQEKQFIASQKEWEKRMVREAIKEASLSGATSLRFPTPYTLSVIEGYLSPSKLEGAELGGIVEYLGTDYIVVEDNGEELTIIPLVGMTKVKISDFEDLVDSGEIGDNTDIYDYYLGDLGYGVKDVNEEYFYFNSRMNPEGIERISSKDTENKGKENFNIEYDLNDTQQTVARKYEEIAEILKKERGEDNFEIVTDENGFDWYETKIESSEVNNPVIAFQKITVEDVLSYANSSEIGLTNEEKIDLQDFIMSLGLDNSFEALNRLEEALENKGIISFNKQRMLSSGVFNVLEVEKILNSDELQNNIKEAYKALKNTPLIEVSYSKESVYSNSAELNSFGKQKIKNPDLYEQEVLENQEVPQGAKPINIIEGTKVAKVKTINEQGELVNKTSGSDTKRKSRDKTNG
jgi:hypothetical protein